MARQAKQSRRVKIEGESDGMKAVAKRITRSLTRKMKAEPMEADFKAEPMDTDSTASAGYEAKVAVSLKPGSVTFLSTLVGHPEIFFDRVVPFLCTSSLKELCAALQPHPTAHRILQDSQKWCYIAQHDDSLGGTGANAGGAWRIVVRTVNIPGACPELSDYLSMRSQRESFDENVIVIPGDLEFITEVNGVKVDCLAFPTSPAFFNPHIGVAACVHRRAGLELERHISSLRVLRSNQLTTPGFGAGVNLLIHCTGPSSTTPNRQRLLYEAYVRALRAVESAERVECAAFASISTGTLGYPVEEAASVAMAAVRDTTRSCKWPTTKKIVFVCVDKRVLHAFSAARDETWRSFPTAAPMFPDVAAGSLV